jgi:hypothetical protein
MLFTEDIKFKIVKVIQSELGNSFLAETLIYDDSAGDMVRYASEADREFICKRNAIERVRLLEENCKLIDELLLTKYELRERQIKSVIDDGDEYKDEN